MHQCAPSLQKAVAHPPAPKRDKKVGDRHPNHDLFSTLGAKEGNARSLPFQPVEPQNPFDYCYACFGHFGSLSQTMLMLLGFNPSLSREGAIEALGSARDVPAGCLGREWDSVHQMVGDEMEGEP